MMSCDLTAFYTEKELQSELNISYREDGWYRAGNDTLLIIREEDQRLGVMIWNDKDPRVFWRKSLSLPLFRLDSGDVMHTEEGWLPPMDDERK